MKKTIVVGAIVVAMVVGYLQSPTCKTYVAITFLGGSWPRYLSDYEDFDEKKQVLARVCVGAGYLSEDMSPDNISIDELWKAIWENWTNFQRMPMEKYQEYSQTS